MKILVTGGAGFIGHHFVKKLVHETNWDITLLDRLDCSGNMNRLHEIGIKRSRFVFHDLKAEINDQLAAQIGEHDYIVHMAAGTHVDRSIADPLSFVMDNVVGTCNILNFARKVGCEKFIYFSTDEVFGPAPAGVRYAEWDRYKSGNPYAATKAGGEELALAFHNTYGVPVIVTHTMNVLGERQHPEKFVPSTIRKVMAMEPVTIHSDKTRTVSGSRFYIHGDDVADAVRFVLHRGKIGDKYNIVGKDETSNLELAQMIAAELGKPLAFEMVDFHSARPGHDLRYALDGSKLAADGWEPSMTTARAIECIVNWSLANDHWLRAA